MAIFKALVTTLSIGSSANDLLLVMSDNDNLEEVSKKIQEWAENEYHGKVITSSGKLNNSNQVFVNDLTHGKYHKVIML